MKAIGCLVFALLAFSLSYSQEQEVLKGKVVNVIDGNTFELMTEDNSSYKIMLYGVDCPEIGQQYADKAKKVLEKLLLNKTITARIQGKDRWGTRQGITEAEGMDDPRMELLEAGLAWTSERNPVPDLEEVKEKAKQKGKGLWSEADPTPPWKYRRQQTMMQAKSS
jgi:endonuclease YncB( thermonuclease family)